MRIFTALVFGFALAVYSLAGSDSPKSLLHLLETGNLSQPASSSIEKKSYYLVPVLCFHNIDGKGPYSLSRFEFRSYLEQIRKNGLQVLPLRSLLRHAKQQRLLQKPSMVITIDDDYKNIARVAAPLLREFGYPATLFFYTKDIYKNPRDGTSWEDLRRLHAEGFDIQNHSYSHTAFHKPRLGESLQDWQKRLRRELFLSRLSFEKNIPGIQIYAFAYPMGYHTKALEKRLRAYRYEVALTTDAKPVDLSRPFRFVFDRYTIQKKYVKDPKKMFRRQIRYAKTPYQEGRK